MKDLIEIPFFTERKKDVYNQLIPLKIFQTWKTRYVSPEMYKNILKNMEMNPEYDYYFFGDEECKIYLQKNYGKEYLDAFEDLIPGAFKADLWRYAILAKEGGVYIDLDIDLKVPLREIIKEDESFVSVKDRVGQFGSSNLAVYQAFIATIPNFIFLKETLELTLNNIKNKYYGTSSLGITGPIAMGKAICKVLKKDEIKFGKFQWNGIIYKFLLFKDKHIFDENERIVFNHKLDDYKKITNYALLFEFSNVYHSQKKILFIKTLLFLFLLFLSIYYKKFLLFILILGLYFIIPKIKNIC